MPQAITTQRITFENGRAATAVLPAANAGAADIIQALNLKDPKAVLLLIGGADSVADNLKPKLTQLFGRGIARAVMNVNAVTVDGGTRAGVMEMMGQGVADRGFKTPLVGVAPLGLVKYPGSTGAGDTPLDPNHSHFVLVDGDRWGSETSTMQLLVVELKDKMPAVALVAGGGEVTRSEVLQAVRQNLFLIVVEGSGGLADEIAVAWRAKPALPDDPVMAEIIADGRIELYQVGGEVKAAEKLIVRQLGGDNVLLQAWQRFVVYDWNAMMQKRKFDQLQMTILAIGFLATLLAVSKEVATRGGEVPPQTFWWYIRYLLVIMPIVVTVLITASNKFKQGNKWLLLRGGAEAIKREIYRYRSRSGDYTEVFNRTVSDPPPPTPDQVLAQRVEDITRRVMQTEVNSSSLKPYPKDKDFPPYVKYSGDDGFSVLTPDRYVQVRLEDQLGYYKKRTVTHEKKLKGLQWSVYIIGGVGTLLAAINQQVWIALTTALATAFTTYLSYQQTESTVTKYNQALTDLENVNSWWTALPAADQAKQENLDTLVQHTEQVMQSELDGWVQQMQNALAELRKDQVKAPETNDTSATKTDDAANKAAADKAAANKAAADGGQGEGGGQGAEGGDEGGDGEGGDAGSNAATEAETSGDTEGGGADAGGEGDAEGGDESSGDNTADKDAEGENENPGG